MSPESRHVVMSLLRQFIAVGAGSRLAIVLCGRKEEKLMQRKVNPSEMLKPTRRARVTCGRLVLAATAVAAVLFAPALHADTWNEKTIMTFSSPVMVPNATLAPGTYVFRIGDFTSNHHIVRIYTEDEQRLITMTQAVPTRRVEANDDIVVMFSPTEAGAPPAVKGWYYPGTRYGHEFIYPEEQARHIADRTRTLVLSGDIPDSASDRDTGRVRHPIP
jgi:hypothetical protein